MFRMRFVCLLLVICCLLGISGMAIAAEVDSDAAYCFTASDFGSDELVGICITGLPQTHTGTVWLGNRVLQTGDILTAEQIDQMTFSPMRTEQDQEAVVTYLPIYENRVDKAATMTISIKGKEDKAPVAQDFTIETYKNLPNKGALKVSDPEGQTLTYSLTRSPKRGTLTIGEDGSFLYTPKKNKVGVDSFTYTATDPAGNVSREATVTIQILKPTDSRQYTDTVGLDCRFEAEWMKNTGLFVGEKIGQQICFRPEQTVSRGDFLAMVVKALDIPAEETSYASLPADTPAWLKPYLLAAQRSGLTEGLPQEQSGSFGADQAITGAEAAVMLQNVLDLSISQETLEMQTASTDDSSVPAWAAVSLTAMSENGIRLQADTPLTRAEAAKILYQVSCIAPDAPGMQVIRMQQ